jgi:hypothetical protein
MLAFAEGRQQITSKHISMAAKDTPEVIRDSLPWLMMLAAVAGVVLLAVLWMVAQ